MAEFTFQATLGTLRPIDDAGREWLRKKHGKLVRVEVTEPRNLAFHNKFFAMLQIVLENQKHYQTTDQLLFVCKKRIGHADYIQTKQGVEAIPKSIKWAKMDNVSFTDFYNRAVHWVTDEVIPGLSAKDLDEAVADELRKFAA